MAKNIKAEINLDKVGKVAGAAEIESIKNISGQFSTVLKEKIDFSIQLKASNRTSYKTKDKLLCVLVIFDLQGFEGGKTKPVLVIGAEYKIKYNLSKQDLSEDELNQFAHINGTYNAWPYWREFVQSATARMGLPPLTVPLFKVPKEVVFKNDK